MFNSSLGKILEAIETHTELCKDFESNRFGDLESRKLRETDLVVYFSLDPKYHMRSLVDANRKSGHNTCSVGHLQRIGIFS